jgi:hypothetical protein
MISLILIVSEMIMIGKTKIRCMDSIYPGFLFDPHARWYNSGTANKYRKTYHLANTTYIQVITTYT